MPGAGPRNLLLPCTIVRHSADCVQTSRALRPNPYRGDWPRRSGTAGSTGDGGRKAA